MAGKSWRDYSTDETVKKETSSEKTGSWRDYSTDQSAASGKSSGGWRDYSKFDITGAASSNVTNRVNAWLQNHKSYLSDYNYRYSGRKYSYDDAYVSDSGSWLETVNKRVDDFEAERQEILSYLDQYSDYLDAKWVKSVQDTLSKGRDAQLQIQSAAQKDNDWWSSFGSEELVKAYGSAEDAYKYYQRDDGYRKKYSGQTYDDLSEIIKSMEDGEEKDWLGSYASHVDYDEKSKFDMDTGTREIESLEAQREALIQELDAADSSIGTANVDRAAMNLVKKIEEIEEQIQKKKAYMDSAKHIQTLNSMSSVTGNKDFADKSKYASNVEYGLFGKPEFTDNTYAYVNNPVVEDKRPLGAGEITARELIGAEKSAYSWDSPLRNRGSSYEREALEQIKPEEVSIYNYYYATQGPEKAREYLDLLVETFRERQLAETFEKTSQFANKHPILASAMSVGTSLGSGFEYLGDIIEYGGDKIAGKDAQLGRNESSLITNAIRGTVSEKVDWEIGNWDAFDFVYNTVMSGADSLASTAFGGFGGTALGLSAAAQGTNDALDRGMSNGQAFWNGLVSGVFEGLFESWSIGKFNALKDTPINVGLKNIDKNVIKEITKNIGKSMLVNATEETLTELANITYDTLVNGEFANYTMEDLKNGAWKQALQQVLEAGASGAFMGIGMSSIGNASALSSGIANANEYASKNYGGSTDALIKEGLESDAKSDSYKLATKYQKQTGKGKALTGQQIRNLVSANEAQFAVEDYDSAMTTAKARLTELGETKDVDKVAKLVAKRATGQELTRAEKSTLAKSQFGAKIAKEMTTPTVETESGTKAYNAQYKSLEERVGTESRFGVSESGQAVIRESGEEISMDNVEVVQTEDGQMTVKLADGKEVYAGDIDFADDTQAYAFSAVADIENITPAAATAIIRDIDLSKPVGAQLNGIDEAYTYGYHGYSVEDLKVGNFAPNLSNEQMMSAYKLGQSARKISDADTDAPVVKMRTAAEAKLTAEQKTAQQKAKIDSKDVEVYFEDGKSVVKFDEHTGKYDAKRTAAVNTAKFLSKLGIGGKYYFFESYENADGVRVYKDANGNEVEAPNGFYKDADGSIHIDLNAGDAGQGTALFTLGHELTHFVKAQSKSQFKGLSDLVTEAFDKTDMSMHERVVAKQDFLSQKRGHHVSYNEALEEVVADAMSTMLTDGSFHEKIMEIKVKDKGLFNTIKRFFEKMIAKFKKVYEELSPDQRDARDIREMKDMFDRIQTAFAEALVEASDNFQAAMESVVEAKAEPMSADEIITEGAVVTDGEGVRHSIRSMKHDIAEGKMFEDLKTVCNWTDAQVNSLRTQLKDLVEYMIPYRNILDMNESYGMEGRRFSPYKPNSDPLYKISMDFSTLCSKRLLTQYVIEQLQLRENRPMSAEEQMAIRDMLNEYRKVEKGLQVACAMCYVEAARLKSPKQVQRWLDDPAPLLKDYFGKKNKEFNDSVKKAQADFKESKGYDREAPKKDMKPADVTELNKIGPKMRSQYKMSAEEQAIVERAKSLPNSTYLTAGNLASLSETDPVIYDAYTAFVRTATRSKSLEKDEPYYYGDSTRDNGNGIVVTDSFIEAVNRENGMRFSSWSDWRIQHLLDYITAVIDNSVRGAAMHGYTKFGDEVRVLGKTGMMFNMSGVAGTQTGLNEDGSLSFSPTESIDVNEAIQLREEFPEHAGLQCIGVGDEHIVALLRSDIIDYVIPYHVSGLNAVLRRMVNIYGWADYTGTQHASIDKSIKFENAVDKEHWHEEPVYSEFFVGYDTGMTGIDAMRASAEKYKQMCKDRGLTPKFNQFANEDNYWKLLIDRKMINQQTGKLIKQRAVTPTFDFEQIKGVVDKFVKNYDAGLEARALNHIVENWDSIPQRIKDLKKQGGTKAKKTKKAAATLANQTVAAQPKDGTKNSDRSVKTFKKDQNANGVFVANALIDLAETDSKWWTGRYNHDILSMSKSDDTEFRQFHQEIEKRTRDMEDYGEQKQTVDDSFIIKDGKGKEFIYRVKLDGYMHGVVLEKIDKAKYVAVLQRVTKGGQNGKSAANIKGRTRNARSGMGRNSAGNGRNRASNGNPGHGGLGGGPSQGNQAGTNSAGKSANRTVPAVTKKSDRGSIGYHAGDLGKAESLGQQGLGRDTGHFGTGTYFVGNKAAIDGYNTRNGKPATVETVDFAQYNLFKPKNAHDGFALHDFLRGVDGYWNRDADAVTTMDEYESLQAKLDDLVYDIESEEFGETDPSKESWLTVEREFLSDAKRMMGDYIVGKALTDTLSRLTDGNFQYDPRSGEYYSYDFDTDQFVYYAEDEIIQKLNAEEGGWRAFEGISKQTDDYYSYSRVSRYETWSDSIKDVAKILGMSEQEVRNVINGVTEDINSSGYTDEDMKTADSAATRFMKALGYEGIDVRGIKELDNTSYGSVIYDLKGEDLARKKEIGTAKYSFRGARSSDANRIAVAEQMERDGKSSEEIRQETGWFRSYDKRWRYEIDDSKAIWHLDTAEPDRTHLFRFGERQYKLKDLLEHDELYKAYPQLKEVTVYVNHHTEFGGYVVGRSTDHIAIQNVADDLTTKWTLIHELQHIIQNIEGFATGASKYEYSHLEWGEKEYEALTKRNEIAKKLYAILRRHGESISVDAIWYNQNSYNVSDEIIEENYFKLQNLGWNNKRTQALVDEYYEQVQILNRTTPEGQYHATAGEIEAYDAQARMNMTAEERKAIRPNIDRSDAIVKLSERGEGTSNRHLLANAFEGITQNSVEYKMLQDYKSHIKELNELETKLSQLNAEIRKIRFGTEGARDTARLTELESEAKEVAKEINRYDKRLLSLEASEPLRKVIERERKKEAQKTKAHVEEIQQNKKVRAEQTELRHKIRKTIRDLDKILNRGNKKLNVKEDVQNVVTKALQAADILFTDNFGTYDMLRSGIKADLSDAEEALVESCTQMLKDLDKMMPTDGYENWQARQEAENRLKTKMSKLKDVFARERKRLNNTTVSSILGELAEAYASLEKSEQSYVQGAYTEAVHNFLKNLQSEVGGTIVKDMTKDQLESVYAAYKMVLTTVRKANQMFNEELKQSREQLGNAVIQEVTKAGGVHGLWTKAELAASRADWNNMKPIWVANRIGSETFGKLMNGLFKGQYNFAVDIDEAKRFKLEMDKKYHPRNWDAEKQYKFESSTGKEFSLSLQQIMSVYAFSKREQAYSHLLNGGFVFESNSTVVVDKNGIKRTYLHDGATSYKLNEATLNSIINSLTKEQKSYVDDMQKYLSEVMGEKGNEVSMQLYGIKMFKEQFYFPLRSSGAYMERAKEAEMKKQQGQINLVNSGFTHAVKPEAKNPIILSGFMDVWAEHCNEMSMYHSMVLPMEDFRKVYNYSTVHDDKFDSASVFQTIQDAYGDAATAYIDQLYRELNAGATVDPRETTFKKLISNFKKTAVMLSASVVVQQFSSIGRAYAVIDPKYFIGARVNSDTNLSVVDEMKKYAPVAIIKEMGGFDTGTKGSAKSYIMAERYGNGERIQGLLKDEQYRSDIMGYLPAKADEKTWCSIWEAVKRETKATHPKMDVKSEEFLKLAGERFSEVIEKTQVYDSVLARSANMRSKTGLMQMATSFMAEPTTTVNLLEDAIRSGNKKHMARAFGAAAVSIVLNNALASVVYAMRDDDEDETFIEKYFQSFTSGMIDDINPMSYYPFLKDVYSLFQGYDVERADMSVIADLRDALKRVVSLMGKDTSSMDDNELAAHHKQVNEVFMGLLDAGCSVFGVPLKNVRRDANGIINAFTTIGKDLSGERNTTWLSFWDKVGAAAKDTIPGFAWTKDKAKTDKLYDAIVSGDKSYLARLKSTYKTDSAYQSAVRKALRENDSRIHEAAQAKYDGKAEEYKRIFREIQKEGKFSFDDIMSAINSEESKIRNGLEPDKATSSYTASDFVEAVAMGNAGEAKAMMEEIISTKVANGKTQEEAEKEFASNVSTGIRDAYSAGLLDEAGAKNMLVEYASKDEEEAASKVSYWDFCNAHPEYELSESNVTDYQEFADPVGIELDVFVQYINGTKNLTTKYDEWGDVEVTKREQVLEVIDSLPLTWQQKDALYLAAGYSESNIWDVPW